jgi:hypothetical protein
MGPILGPPRALPGPSQGPPRAPNPLYLRSNRPLGPGPRPLGGPKYPIFTLRRALWALAPGPWEGPNTLYLPLEGPPQLGPGAQIQGPRAQDPGYGVPGLDPGSQIPDPGSRMEGASMEQHPQQLQSSCWGWGRTTATLDLTTKSLVVRSKVTHPARVSMLNIIPFE